MGKKCFVPNCNSGYKSCKEKVTIFGAPKDKETLTVWGRIISRRDKVLSEKDFVCAKHFKEEDIIKEWTDEYNHIPHKYFRLKKGALPTIFPNCPNNLTTKPSQKRRQMVKHDLVKKKRRKSDSTVVENPNESKSFFKLLWDGDVNIKYPNEFWSLNKIQNKTTHYISFVKLSMNFNEIPFIEKQILVNEEITIQVFINGQLLDNMPINDINTVTVTDISAIVDQVDQFVSCKGVLLLKDSTIFNYVKRCRTGLVNTVNNTIRHKNCQKITKTREMCSKCHTLNNNLETTKRKSQCKTVAAELRNQRQKNYRLRNRYKKLQSDLNRIKNNILKKIN